MQLNVLNFGIFEQFLEHRRDLFAIANASRDHEVSFVVSARRHEARSNAIGYLAGRQATLLGTDADIDRTRRAEWRFNCMVGVGNEEQLIADFRIDKADATRIARRAVGPDTPHVQGSKFAGAEIRQVSKVPGRQAEELKRGHG
ncbi:MAG TPA: hypothetical protein VLS52_12190, partial [Rudaea sp.]|nr:hypothetical protein [Rudaea sp.]